MKYGDYSARYGTFLYGSTDNEGTGSLRYELAINWDGTSDYYDNEALYLLSWSTERGRDNLVRPGGAGFEPYDTGKATFVLDNSTKRFDPYYAAGALYGNLAPGKMMRFRVWDSSDNVYSVFTGTVDDIINEPESQTCTIKCVDGWDYLRTHKVKSAVLEGQDLATIIDAILDYIGWPWGRNTPTVSLPMADWVSNANQSAAALIWDLVMSTMIDFYITPDGTAHLDRVFGAGNETTDTSAMIVLTEDEIGKRIILPDPWEMDFDIALVNCRDIFDATTDTQQLYLSSVLSFAGTESKTIWAKYANKTSSVTGTFIGATGMVYPVASTDFVGNSAADGTGADTTSDFGVVFTDYGTEAKLVITNTSSSDNYLTFLQLRGIPLVYNAVSYYYPSTDSDSEKTKLTVNCPWLNTILRGGVITGVYDGIGAIEMTQLLAIFDQNLLESATITIENRPDLQFHDTFEYDNYIGIDVKLTLAYYGGADLYCRIGKITHESGITPQQVLTTIKLEPIYIIPAT